MTAALRVSGVLLLGAGLASLASPAGANVVLSPIVNGPDRARIAPPSTLITPEGVRIRLAGHRIGDDDDGLVRPAASPDGRFVARRFEQRIVLLPTDGGPARLLSAPGARPQYFAGQLWWDASGERVFMSNIRDGSGAPAVERCVVATGRCTTVRVGDRDLVAPLPSGAAVWSSGSPWDTLEIAVGSEDEVLDADDLWIAASRGDVRRVRRALRRPDPTSEVVLGPDGALVRRLWSARRSAAAGVFDAFGVASGPAGALVARVRVRHVLRTRMRRGRLQLRLAERRERPTLWRIDDTGARTRLAPRSADGDRLDTDEPAAGTADGWAGRLATRHGTPLIGTMSADGTVRRLRVAGRPLTVQALHDALGRPADERPADAVLSSFGVAAYEASTGSLIVRYDDAASRSVVSRVPLDGRAPTLVTRAAKDASFVIAAS